MNYETSPGKLVVCLTRSDILQLLKKLDTPGCENVIVSTCNEGVLMLVAEENSPWHQVQQIKQGGVEL